MIIRPRLTLLLLLLFILLTAIGVYLYPPPHIDFLAGPRESTFYTEAEQYKKILHEHGVTVDIIETAGTMENLKLLQKAKRPTVAFADAVHELEAAMGKTSGLERVTSLGAIYLNPLWIFVPKESNLRNFEALERKNSQLLGAGWEGSSERMLASLVLKSIGMEKNVRIATIGQVDQPITSAEAVEALREGHIAALLTIGRPDSPLIEALWRSPELATVHMARAEAYQLHFPFLKAVSLPEGGLDLRANIPDRELQLLAASTELLVSDLFPPSIADLLLEATSVLHGGGSWFSSPNEFPNSQMASISLNSSAARYYESGPPLLRTILPFRWATWLDRISMFVIACSGVAIAALTGIPRLMELSFIRKLERAYRQMEIIEKSLHSGCDRAEALCQLDELERSTTQYKLWLPRFLPQWMEMRQNLHDLRDRVSN